MVSLDMRRPMWDAKFMDEVTKKKGARIIYPYWAGLQKVDELKMHEYCTRQMVGAGRAKHAKNLQTAFRNCP